MLRSLLIAIAAALLVGAALTERVEAQGWTCNFDFTQGVPANWTNNGFTVTGSGLYRTQGYGELNYTGPSTTFTSVSMTLSASGSSSWRHVATGPSPYYIDQFNTWLTAGTQSFSASGFSASLINFAYDPGNTTGYLLSATVSGTGTSPCPATPTPTPVPSSTPVPTATNTPLPTSTGVPYPTEAAFIGAQGDSYWGNTYNMTYGLQGWSLLSGTLGGGRVVSADVGGTQRLEMEYPLGNVKVTDVFANYEASCAHTFEVKDGNTVFEAGSVGSGMQALVWQGEHVMSNGSLKISLVGGSGCGVSAFQLYEITIMGYGTNPTNLQATAIAFEAGNLYSGLSDVNTLLESLPASINSGVPDETGRTLFGYAKWLISPSSADELAGPFAPIVSHTGIFVSLTFALVLVYAIVWAAVWIFRFVVWLFRIILQIIQVVVSVIGSIFKFFF